MSWWQHLVGYLAGPIIEARVKEQMLNLPLARKGDENFRRMTANPQRDLTPLAQDRQAELAYYLYKTNGLATRMLELPRDMVVGDGFKFTAENEDVAEVLERFWNDGVNQMDLTLDQRVLELGMYGEQCYPVFVSPHMGRVRLGYLDPTAIEGIQADPENAAILLGVQTKQEVTGKPRRYAIILNEDAETVLSTAGRQLRTLFNDGACFFFSVNRALNATRGSSDLLPLLDWLDAYENWLFDRLEWASQLGAFLWDVTLKGMNEDQIRQWLENNPPPKRGSVRAHNEAVQWQAVSPELKGDDLQAIQKVFLHHILSVRGWPEHWFTAGGEVTRACHDMETETLTERGWLPYHEIHDEDRIGTINPETGALEFHRPTRRYRYPYSGPMMRIRNKQLDLLVTPDHRMWAKRERNDPGKEAYEIIQAQQMVANRWCIPVAGKWEGEQREIFLLPEVKTGPGRAIYPEVVLPMDLWLEFLGYMISEGHVREKLGQYTVNLAQKKPEGIARIDRCLSRLPFEFRRSISKDDGTVRWVVNDKGLNVWLREQCGSRARQKHLPEFVHGLYARQLRILFDALMVGDGHIPREPNARWSIYYTTSRQLADDVQVLAFKLGLRAKTLSHRIRGRKGLHYRVYLHSRSEALAGQDAIHRVEGYAGDVYCFEVPNHLFVTRRNGKVAVTHNTAAEMGDPILKTLAKRQGYVKYMLAFTGRYVVRQAINAGLLREKVPVKAKGSEGTVLKAAVETFKVEAPEISAKDINRIGQALAGVSASLMIAQSNRWIQPEDAAGIFAMLASMLGREVEPAPQDQAGGPGGEDFTPERLAEMRRRLGMGNGKPPDGDDDPDKGGGAPAKEGSRRGYAR